MKKAITNTEILKIRPAARHILTIGRDLIKDNTTALLELIKNSYDADAEHVTVTFESRETKEGTGIVIRVEDDGHGMDYETVTGAWLVPSTTYKQSKTTSPEKGRTLQGRKGIGRYAASILGDQLQMETVTKTGDVTQLALNWKDFEKKEFLEDVDIEVSRQNSKRPHGTMIEVQGGVQELSDWDETQINILKKELRRLISPIHEKENVSDFDITLKFHNFPYHDDESIPVKPLPILDVFDYRISGTISGSGEAQLTFENSASGVKPDVIKKHIKLKGGARYCGDLRVDIKVYDRDADSLDRLISRINKKSPLEFNGDSLSKNEARNFLTEMSGIAVYRGGFRIRPHGDPGYDWLQLDKRRVQRPGYRLGNDRVSGFVEIQSEYESSLV